MRQLIKAMPDRRACWMASAMSRRAPLRCTGRRREHLANPLGEVEVVEPGSGCGPLVLFGAFIVVLMVLVGFAQW